MNPQISREQINRANSQHSTGPQTEAGKQRSSQNALRHGLTAQRAVLPGEDLQAYQHHLKSFTTEYHPQGSTETHLVQALADTSWRLNRAAALETSALALTPNDENDLLTLLERQSKVLANLSLHTQRLSRQFERTLAQLLELQKTRRSREKSDLDDLLDIMEMFATKQEPYDPAADGFVFSKPQIAAAQHLRRRESLALEAYDYAA